MNRIIDFNAAYSHSARFTVWEMMNGQWKHPFGVRSLAAAIGHAQTMSPKKGYITPAGQKP